MKIFKGGKQGKNLRRNRRKINRSQDSCQIKGKGEKKEQKNK